MDFFSTAYAGPRLSYAALIAFVLGIVSCATVTPARIEGVHWPPSASGEARVRLDRIVTGPEDLGMERPWYSRLWRFLAGESEIDRFIEPYSVALSGSHLVVGDTTASAVWVFDLSENRFQAIRTIDGTAIRLPVGVAIAEDGIWISDSLTQRLDLISFEGEPIRAIVPASRPAGIALSRHGVLAVALPAAHQVALYYPDGTSITLGGPGIEQGGFNFPTQVVFSPDDSLLVSDALNFRVQTFSPGNRFVSMFGERGDVSGYFARPRGIAVDAAKHVYVVDALFDVVQVFDAGGELMLVVGQAGDSPGEFWLPAGIAIDGQAMAVADASNGRVQMFELQSPQSTSLEE